MRVPQAVSARDEARRHCPIPATSYCIVDMEMPVDVLFIYLVKHQPSLTCSSEFLCGASEESCSDGAPGETAAEILDSDPF